MPSNKTLSIIIVCLSLVFCVWLFSRETSNTILATSKNQESFFSNTKTDNGVVNDDWKSLLSTIDSKEEKIINLTNTTSSTEDFDDTTITAQISRDLLSQYLLLKKEGGELTEEDMTAIVANIATSPSYTTVPAPVYIASNLKITAKNDSATHEKYKYNVNLIIKTRDSEITEDPTSVIIQLAGSNPENAIKKLNFMIEVGKRFIGDMLIIEVPQKAVKTHLELLNAVSKLVTSAEASGQIAVDPIKGLAGVNDYNNSVTSFQNAVKRMLTYLSQN